MNSEKIHFRLFFMMVVLVAICNVNLLAPTGASVQPKVGHWCLQVQAVCDRSMVQPKKIKQQIKTACYNYR